MPAGAPPERAPYSLAGTLPPAQQQEGAANSLGFEGTPNEER